MGEIKVEISTPKVELANQLANYSRKDQREILKAARCLQKYLDLTSVELTDEEEADEIINGLEEIEMKG